MIRIGFLLNYPTSYKGGINYFRNLFYAVNGHFSEEVEILLFVPSNLAQEYVDLFSPFVKIIKTKALQRKSSLWYLDKVSEKLIGANILLDQLMQKYKIDIVSHSSFVSKKVKTINWIMDFQHFHFPELYSQKEINAVNRVMQRIIEKGDAIFLSSFGALKDFESRYAKFSKKVKVLHFVCQPSKELKIVLNTEERDRLVKKYEINRPFFYLPNQFWAHKNHKLVFEAVLSLKQKGYDPLLVTSGLMSDYRSKRDHIQELINFVSKNHLNNNILFLGLIPYEDVSNLLVMSDLIINPSYFEGWSSTVEEAKTIGKHIALSNIDVHLEQKPEFGIYFNPDNVIELTDILVRVIEKKSDFQQKSLDSLRENLNLRTKEFASQYIETIKKVLNF
ncbi:glycosyltransferase family 4 protein [Pedobacter sp.]